MPQLVRVRDVAPLRVASDLRNDAPPAGCACTPPRQALCGHAPSRGSQSAAPPDVLCHPQRRLRWSDRGTDTPSWLPLAPSMPGAPRSALRGRCVARVGRLCGPRCIAPGVDMGGPSAPPPDSTPRPLHAPHCADASPARSASRVARLGSARHPALAPRESAPSPTAHFPAGPAGRLLSRDRPGVHVQSHLRPSRRPSQRRCRPRPLVSTSPSAASCASASAVRSQPPSPGRTRHSSRATAHPPHGWFA